MGILVENYKTTSACMYECPVVFFLCVCVCVYNGKNLNILEKNKPVVKALRITQN